METVIADDNNQKVFRKLMTAMSSPGQLYNLEAAGKEPLMDILDVLLDHEVSFCVIGSGKEQMQARIAARTGSKPEDISSADFIIAADGNTNGELDKAKRGSLEYPDKGATIIYCVNSIDKDKKNEKFIFKGPGISENDDFMGPGIAESEIEKIAGINSEYPLGVDTVIISEKADLICMPRSLRITRRK